MNLRRCVWLTTIILLVALTVTACAKKVPPPPPPPPPAPAGCTGAAAAAATATASSRLRRRPPPRPLTEDEIFSKKTVDELNAEMPLADVSFDYDMSIIRDDQRATLQKNADYLRRWTSVRVTIEGHADARGTNEYNLALGERRGNAVRDYLVGLGIAAERMTGDQQGRGVAAVHGGDRRLFRAEPPRPLHHHGEVASDTGSVIRGESALTAVARCRSAPPSFPRRFLRGAPGIGRRNDGPADDQMAGPRFHGFGRSHGPRLIVLLDARRRTPDSRRDDGELRAARGSNRGAFPGATRPRRRARPAAPSVRARSRGRKAAAATPPARSVLLVHAREHGDADDERLGPARSCRGLGGGLRRRLHHRHAARGVDVDHPGAGEDCCLDGLSHGVGDVVKLQIQEDASSLVGERRTRAGPSRVKRRLPTLTPSTTPRSVVASSSARCARFDVEGD